MSATNKRTLKKYKTTSELGTNQNTEKLERKKLSEQQRRIKPGECLKYIRVNIDPEFLSAEAGSKILHSLDELGTRYQIKSHLTPRIITWERSEQQMLVMSIEDLTTVDEYIPEKELIFLMSGEELVKAIKEKTLEIVIKDVQENYPGMSTTLIVFGLKSYCRQNPSMVKRNKIDYALTEIQILLNCCHRLFETAEEVALTISQYTKAIAEIPFKKQQEEKTSNLNIFLQNDNKDCVRVDGSSGLSRLWQQHLTRLPLVTLETAEAIINEYPTPRKLLEAYDKEPNGALLLADLKIRRAGGPLSTTRRIGPELSRKIYTLYSSLDPNEKL